MNSKAPPIGRLLLYTKTEDAFTYKHIAHTHAKTLLFRNTHRNNTKKKKRKGNKKKDITFNSHFGMAT